jgi:hypothetical protein
MGFAIDIGPTFRGDSGEVIGVISSAPHMLADNLEKY